MNSIMLFNKHKVDEIRYQGAPSIYECDVKDLAFKLEKPKDFETINTRQIQSVQPVRISEQEGISLREFKEAQMLTSKNVKSFIQQAREIIEELHMQNFNTCKFNPDNIIIHKEILYIMDIQRSYSRSFKFLSKLKTYLQGPKELHQYQYILDCHQDDILDRFLYLQQENIELNFSLFKVYLCNKVVRKLTKLEQCPPEMKDSFKILRAIAVEECIKQTTNPDILELLKKQPRDSRDVVTYIRNDFRTKLKPVYAAVTKKIDYPKLAKLQLLLVMCHIFQRVFDPMSRSQHFGKIVELYSLKELTNVQQVYLFYKTADNQALQDQVTFILEIYFKK